MSAFSQLPAEASAARKGARRDLTENQNKERAESASQEGPIEPSAWRHRQIAGTPNRLSNTKRLAGEALVAGVTTRGTVTASRGEADVRSNAGPTDRRKWVIRSQVRLDCPAQCGVTEPDAVHRLHDGGWLCVLFVQTAEAQRLKI